MTGAIYVGTSGWHYDHWRGSFYPPDLPAAQMLAHYASYLRTVEINTSFYRLPSSAALQSWCAATPEDFRFAMKASRYVTHLKKLKDPQVGLARFLAAAETLGAKLGPILFQLPPHWSCDRERLAAFLSALPAGHRCAFELRDPSWHVPTIYQLLARQNVAFCVYELAGYRSPLQVTADFVYVRLHGPRGAYQGCYDEAALTEWARRLREWRRDQLDCFVYFDNDEAGFAARNALELQWLLTASADRSGASPRPDLPAHRQHS